MERHGTGNGEQGTGKRETRTTAVLVDGSRLETECDPAVALSDVVELIRKDWQSDDRILVAIRCDDEEVIGEELESILDTPLSEFDRVEFQTGSARDLAGDVLEHVSALLIETREIQSQVVDLLGQGSTPRAMELLSGCFGVWKQAQEGLSRAAEVLNLDLDTVEFEGATIGAFVEELAAALRKVRESLKTRDYVMLADVLAYELEPICERWPRLNGVLLERVSPGTD